ncbi:major facilitator superfamily domain-containing protein [Phaeosphaeria sp. MPI-PUGE-AT-0046c]|nr:major facilitator superfamily domain-containing protein [Phaeosphaeria sp. MPI-PUGE-AT-0046c]
MAEKSLHVSPVQATKGTAVITALDLEKPSPVQDVDLSSQEQFHRLRLEYGSTWLSPSDPSNPYNWPSHRKILIGVIFSFGQLIPIMSASMIAPSLGDIAHDLRISASTAQITLSSYFLGMAFAPLIIAALSEMYGRKKVWVACNAWYVLWNALCPVGRSAPLMIVGRFMTGAGACVGVTLNGPVMADMYGKEDRGKSLAIVTLLPYLGPALGPLLGGVVSELVHWSWIFWIMSLVDTVILLLGLIVIRETYTPVLLRRKAKKEGTTIPRHKAGETKLSRMKTDLLRPLHIIIHRPIIWLISLLGTLSFGVYCIILSSYATLWIEKYHQTKLISSVHYISIALGTTLAGQIGSQVLDRTYRAMSKRNGGSGTPEHRIPCLVSGMVMMPIGLFWYGWSAEHELHWIMVDIGTVVFTLGSFVGAQAITAYQLDEFAEYGASANAASRVVSYVLAFLFPIFAPSMYAKLGYGWGNSTLALATIVLGFPSCWVLWIWGARLRALGRDVRADE